MCRDSLLENDELNSLFFFIHEWSNLTWCYYSLTYLPNLIYLCKENLWTKWVDKCKHMWVFIIASICSEVQLLTWEAWIITFFVHQIDQISCSYYIYNYQLKQYGSFKNWIIHKIIRIKWGQAWKSSSKYFECCFYLEVSKSSLPYMVMTHFSIRMFKM